MEITPYDFSGKTVRVIMDEKGNPWWVASEVCCVLGLSNPSKAVTILDDDEKSTLTFSDSAGGPERLIINEPGLYRLLSRSNKKRAKKFQRWIFHRILPSIRKTGAYQLKPENLSKLEILELALESEKGRIEAEKKLKGAKVKINELQPKADAYDWIANAEGLSCLSDGAKIIGIRPHTFTNDLVRNKYLFYRRGQLIPYQQYADEQFKVELVRASDGSNHTYRQTFITPKGVVFFRTLYNKQVQKRLFS